MDIQKYIDKLNTSIAGNITPQWINENLQMYTKDQVTVNYAPFDYVNTSAKVIIVGITPGMHQAEVALNEFAGMNTDTTKQDSSMKAVKHVASFSGPMRNNLIKMLDHIGLNRKLGITSCLTLFDERADLVQFTSALRYPTFIQEKNYNGTPSFKKIPFLTSILEEVFLQEILSIEGKPLIIPLGPKVEDMLEFIMPNSNIEANQVLSGLPHPSGANAERIAYFLGNKAKEDLSTKTNPHKIDEAKIQLIKKVNL